MSDLCHSRGTSVAPVQHIEPSCVSSVLNITEVSMGWWDIPLEGHPMDTVELYFIAVVMLELLLLLATFSLL